MPLYAITIFCSAFLLFLVQPIMAKQILPWFGGSAECLDDLPRLFPARAAARLRLCGSGRAPTSCTRAVAAARGAARAELPDAADRSRRALETAGRREPGAIDSRPARAYGGTAVFPAVDDQPARAVVVRATVSRSQPVSAICSVESRVDAGAGRLSVRARTMGDDSNAILRLVGRLRAVRAVVRRMRLVRLAHSPGERCESAGAGHCGRSAGGGPAHAAAPAPLGGAGRDGLVPAARRHQSHLREHFLDPALVDRAAVDLSADVHSLLRQLALVSPRPGSRDARCRPGGHGLHACRSAG